MINLQAESERLEAVLEEAVAEWHKQLEVTNAEIAEFDKVLAEKESKTDRSENATFQIASDGKSAKMAIKQMLTDKLNAYSNHKAAYASTGVVKEGSTVALNSDGQHLVVKIVPAGLSDALKGLVDTNAPVGKAAMGLSTGASFVVRTRRGKVPFIIEGVY